jgi:hypothetical protein
MIQYIFAALLAWNPPAGSRGTTPDETLLTYATAIDAVCVGPRECLMLAAIASRESRFAPYILDGACNRARAVARSKRCDNGLAFGAWKMHEGAWSAPSLKNLSPLEHARIACRIYRTSPYLWTTLRLATKDVDAYISLHLPPRE